MAKALTEYHGLTSKQAALVTALAEGHSELVAYETAGYAGSRQQAVNFVRQTMRLPHVALALHAAVAARLQADAPVARAVALAILQDEKAPAKTRADLAVKLLRLAGHVEPRAAIVEKIGEKSLAEMSREELHAAAAQLEDELARRATPVNSANAVPPDLQASDLLA